MRRIKIISLILAMTMLTALFTVRGSAEEIGVRLDDEKIECPVPARIENGRTMVPMRAIFEAFGMDVQWNNDEKSVTATNGDTVIKLTVGDKTLYVNGEAVQMDVAPYIADDTTLVPVRAVSESLDATVTWNEEKRRVEIVTKAYEENKDAWKENTGTINVTDMTVTGDGAEAISVQYENTGISAVKITKGGDFEVTGENDNAMIWVDANEKVKLRLSGVKMTNPSGPVIYYENAKEALITISKGTENHITDGEEYLTEVASAKAAIFANDDMEIKGSGTLYVTSKAHHAIASDDDIKIEEGTLILCADKKDGIHANNTITIKDGNIDATAYGDGIQAEENIAIEGGVIEVKTNGDVPQEMDRWGGGMMPPEGFGGRGGRARNNNTQVPQRTEEMPPTGGMPMDTVMPLEGMENMTPPEGFDRGMMPPEGMENMMPPEGFGGGMSVETAEEPAEDENVATKGIKAETDITISGGSIIVNAMDHAIHSAGTLTVTGGEMQLSSQKGKGISAHGDVVIDGGVIDITKATEGLESKANLTINSGSINITGSDDGINAGGTGGRDVANRQNSEQTTGHDLTINGGEIFVNAAGDGLDANGRMIINGGNIIVEGPTNSGNGALDSGGIIKINGGTLIALGASGMAEVPDNDSLQPVFRLVTDYNIPTGSVIAITNESGDEICRYTTQKTGNSIVFSSDKLSVGKTYTVTIGETEHKVEMTSTVTSSGNGGFGGFGGGGRRW